MAETDANASATASAPVPSAGAGTQVGTQTEQPANNTVVESANAEVNGNSGSSDENNGSDGKESVRQRPSRAERRIAQLTERIKSQESVEQENARLRELLSNPIAANQISLPDRSQQEVITPEQYQQDLVNAADQIVKLRLNQTLGEHTKVLTRQQANERVLEDIDTAVKIYPELNPDNEQYDPELENYLATQFERSFQADPTYRFKSLVDETMKIRGKVAKTTNKSADGKPAEKSTASTGGKALKSSTAKPSHKPVEEMNSDEFLDFIRAGGTVS